MCKLFKSLKKIIKSVYIFIYIITILQLNYKFLILLTWFVKQEFSCFWLLSFDVICLFYFSVHNNFD